MRWKSTSLKFHLSTKKRKNSTSGMAASHLPDTPVHIPLKKFSEEKLEDLKIDWHKLTGDLHVAGLRYWWGSPVVFPRPNRLLRLSPKMLRAELPVHSNNTL
jgi:hypothetical protein